MDNVNKILFDVDGTITKTMERQEQWFKYWAKKNNVVWPHQSFDEFLISYNASLALGGAQKIYDDLGLPCNMEDRNHFVWKAFEDFNVENSPELYPQMEMVIKTLVKMKNSFGKEIRLGINTSNSAKTVYSDLKKYGIFDYFDFLITADTLKYIAGERKVEDLKKPNNFSVGLALKLWGCYPEEMIFVGDTLDDLKSSLVTNKKRVITVGALYGYEGEKLKRGAELGDIVDEEKIKLTFDHFIQKPTDLLKLVKSEYGFRF